MAHSDGTPEPGDWFDTLPIGDTATMGYVLLTQPEAGTPTDAPCPHCCPWTAPLHATWMGRETPFGAALLYDEWLLWHLHVVLHQRGGLLQ